VSAEVVRLSDYCVDDGAEGGIDLAIAVDLATAVDVAIRTYVKFCCAGVLR
jgi:hypothetical protein